MRVLLALNRSLDGGPAEDEAIARPWPAGSVVRVLTILEDPLLFTFTPETASPAFVYTTDQAVEGQRALLAKAALVAQTVAREGERRRVFVERSIRHGMPAAEIVEEARRWDADLIVLGRDQRTGLERLFTRDIDSYVVTHAPCSVEVVRAHA